MHTTLINAQTLQAHLHHPDWVIVDCRFSLADTEAGRRAHRESHIPGTWYAHLDEDLSGTIIPGKTGRHPLPEVEALEALFTTWGIGPGVQVIVYDDMGGAIAARLWWMLRWLGHEAVAVLAGGWPSWQAAGYATNNDKPTPGPGTFQARPRMDMKVDAALVDQVREDTSFVVVDSRAAERYAGREEPIDPVAGHIPGAINLPHTDHLEEGRWKSEEAIRTHFADLIPAGTPADKTIFYCGSGVTACRNILAYKHAGLGDALLYPGSWSEWIVDPERPVG